jgi:hypothetical protein
MHIVFNFLPMISFRSLIRFGFFSLLLMIPSVAFAATFTSSVYDGPHKVNAIDTEHFTIEYSAAISNGADSDGDGIPDLVENAAEYSEFSWEQAVDALGHPDPLANYANYQFGIQQSKVFVILDDAYFYVDEGSVGVTSVLFDGALYMALDPQISMDLLKVTIAHEFAHIIQFSYQGDFIGFDQDLNFAEQTAVSLEDYVYDDVNDYYNYLRHFYDYPDYSVFTGIVPPDSLFEYGLGVWPIFVTEYLDDWSFVPKVIQAFFDEPVPDVWDAYEAYTQVFEEDYDTTLNDVFQEFALWNYIPAFYEEGANYPMAHIHMSHQPSEYPLNSETPPSDQLPALYGTNYVQLFVDDSMQGQDLKLTIDKKLGIDLGVIVLPESDELYLVNDKVTEVFASDFDKGTITVPIDENTVVFTVIVTPFTDDPMSLESAENAFSFGYDYFYSVEIGDFLDDGEAQVESDTNGTMEGDGESDKGGVAAGSNLPEGGTDLSGFDELTVHGLEVTTYDDDSVSLSWSRLRGEGVTGYNIHYGYEEGDYFLMEEVDGAHITHYTVDDLVNYGGYYFVVKGVGADGEESGQYSNEVSVDYGAGLTESVDYPDVPESHRNHGAIDFLTQLDLFEGYPDGTFRPGDAVNRAELMKILVADEVDYLDDKSAYENCFPDVKDEWFAPYVCYAFENEWVKGYDDGLFHPERTVTKAESLKMVFESSFGEVTTSKNTKSLPFSDVFGSAWYASYVIQADRDGLLEASGSSFGANNPQSRSQVAEIIYRYFIVLWMDDGTPFSEEAENQFMIDWESLMADLL